MASKFQLKKSKNDKFFFSLHAGNGQGILSSEMYEAKASALAGETLDRADANQVRAVTGFAIGGVSPLGHLTPLPLWMDAALLTYPTVWAAAGTPRHIFAIAPAQLQQITGAIVADFTV